VRGRTYGIVLKARQKESAAVVALKKFKVTNKSLGLISYADLTVNRSRMKMSKYGRRP
jgi:hypothetical protein